MNMIKDINAPMPIRYQELAYVDSDRYDMVRLQIVRQAYHTKHGTLTQRWASIADGGPAINQRCFNVSCSLPLDYTQGHM